MPTTWWLRDPLKAPKTTFDLCARFGWVQWLQSFGGGHGFLCEGLAHWRGSRSSERNMEDALAFRELRGATPCIDSSPKSPRTKCYPQLCQCVSPGAICTTSGAFCGENTGTKSYLSFSKENEFYVMIVPKSQSVPKGRQAVLDGIFEPAFPVNEQSTWVQGQGTGWALLTWQETRLPVPLQGLFPK